MAYVFLRGSRIRYVGAVAGLVGQVALATVSLRVNATADGTPYGLMACVFRPVGRMSGF